MVEVARFFMHFTQNESCGKCVPCREGTKRMLEILERIVAGKGRDGDIELLLELADTISATALCGLGKTAPSPVVSTIKNFRSEYEAHIYEKRCPAGNCQQAQAHLHRSCAVQGLLQVLPRLPCRRDQRHDQIAVCDRPGEVHQVRRVRRHLSVPRHQGGLSMAMANKAIYDD